MLQITQSRANQKFMDWYNNKSHLFIRSYLVLLFQQLRLHFVGYWNNRSGGEFFLEESVLDRQLFRYMAQAFHCYRLFWEE